jgi:hypothetical protein
VTQVNIPAATGDMGILANHVASVEAIKPGVIEVIESAGSSKKWFGESFFQLFDSRSWQPPRLLAYLAVGLPTFAIRHGNRSAGATGYSEFHDHACCRVCGSASVVSG